MFTRRSCTINKVAMRFIQYIFPAFTLCCWCINTSCQVKTKPSQDSVYQFKQSSAEGTGKFYLGREIAPVMGTGGGAWLNRSEREDEENVTMAINKMRLQANSVVADIGAGTGYYTFRIAPKIAAGKIYAVEAQEVFITQLKQEALKRQLNNVVVVKGSPQSVNIAANTLDFAFMVDVYHELQYPHEMLLSLHSALKPGGKLLLLEYRAEDPSIPIKELHKMSVAQVNKEMAANGFKLIEQGEFLPIQHFLLYIKTGN